MATKKSDKRAKAVSEKAAHTDASALGHKTAGVATSILFSKLVSVIVAGLSFVLVSRLLGPTTYGVYVLATSFAGVFISVGAFGINTALPKFIAEYRSKGQKKRVEDVVASGYISIISIGIVMTLIAVAFGPQIAQLVFKSSSFSLIAVVAALSITFSLLYDASYGMLVGFGKQGFLVTLTLVQIVTQSVVSIVLVLMGFGAFGPVIGLLTGLIIGSVFAMLSIYSQEKLKFSFHIGSEMKTLIMFSIPIGVYGAISGFVSNVSNLILGYYANPTIVGNVGVAIKFSGVIALAVDSVGIALLPLFASLTHKRHKAYTNKLYNYSVCLMLSILVPIVLVISVVAPNVTVILWPTYTSLPYLIPIVSIGIIFFLLANYTSTLLISNNKVKEVMIYSVISSAIQLLLLFALVPSFKGIGLVAIVALFSPMLSFAFYIRLASKLLKIKLEYGKLLRISAASLVCAAVIFPMTLIFSHSSVATLASATILLLLIYPPLVVFFKGVTSNDLTVIKGMSNTLPVVGPVLSILANYALRWER
jgi:O-antigen/teichoic acid export membrane protein